MLASRSVLGHGLGPSVDDGKAQRVVQLLADDDEPPEPPVGLLAEVVVVRTAIAVGELGGSGAGGGRVLPERFEPDGFEDAALLKELSGFVDSDVLWRRDSNRCCLLARCAVD